MEDRRKNRARKKGIGKAVPIRRGIALGKSGTALSPGSGRIAGLLDSRRDPRKYKRHRINLAAPRKLKLLLWRQRSRILCIAYVEIGKDSEDALLLFKVQLRCSNLMHVRRNRHLRCGSDQQNHRRQFTALTGCQLTCKRLHCKPLAGNGQLVRPGWQTAEDVAALIVRKNGGRSGA